mgnify:CR=1 FL=1
MREQDHRGPALGKMGLTRVLENFVILVTNESVQVLQFLRVLVCFKDIRVLNNYLVYVCVYVYVFTKYVY